MDFMSAGASRSLPRNKDKSLPSSIINQERPSSVTLQPEKRSPEEIKRQRCNSATLPRNNKDRTKTLTIPRISDDDCGFHLIAQASDESLVDMCSVYSEQCYFGVEITGRILLGTWYKHDEKRLYVRIVKAENLAEAADGALDPYVKTYLLPGIYKSNKRKTGLQYDTTKPAWNELLKVSQ